MFIKNMINGEARELLENIETRNDFIIPKGTVIEMINILNTCAIINIHPIIFVEGSKKLIDVPVYKRCIISGFNMHAKVK